MNCSLTGAQPKTRFDLWLILWARSGSGAIRRSAVRLNRAKHRIRAAAWCW